MRSPGGEEFGTSVHRIVRFSMNAEYDEEVKAYQKRYNYFKADYDKVRRTIRDMNLDNKLADLNLNDKWKQFVSCMKEVVEGTVPTVKRICKKRPWVTKEVQRSRRTKIKAWKRMQQMRQTTHGEMDEIAEEQLEQAKRKYVRKRNAAKATNRTAIKEYEEKLSQNIKKTTKVSTGT